MKILELQALRAIAAYLVLFHHILGTELGHAERTGLPAEPLMTPFYSGYSGVDLFFAISGFVMVFATYRLPAGIGQSLQFWLARIFRIYPVWWLYCILFSVLCIIIAGTVWHPSSFNPAETNGWLFLLKSWFLIPQENLPHINVGWTLIHEIYFYLVFGLLLLLPRKLMLPALLAWAGIIIAVAVAYPGLTATPGAVQVALSPFTLEFIAGALAGWLFATGRRWFHGPVLLVGIAAFAAAFILVKAAPAPALRVAIFAIPAALVVYGASGLSGNMPGAPLRRWLGRLGDWSFSLYLSHPLVLLCLGALFFKSESLAPAVGLPASLFTICGNPLFTLAAIIAATIVAGVSYHYFEKPVLSVLNRRFRRRQADKTKAKLLSEVAP